VWKDARKAYVKDSYEAARMVRAASVLDVTAEAVVQAVESGAALHTASNETWGLSFRDLQVRVDAQFVHVRGPLVLMHHLRRMGFRQPGPPPSPPPAHPCPAPHGASSVSLSEQVASAMSCAPALQPDVPVKVVMEVEQVARLMAADLDVMFRDSSASPPPVRGTDAPTQTATKTEKEGDVLLQHVTPKSVVALIERSVEVLSASASGGGGGQGKGGGSPRRLARWGGVGGLCLGGEG